jgi:pyridoxine 5'-phosphate synthase PdxJ
MRNPQIDKILKEMASLYTNIGTDSTEQEKQQAKQQELQLIGEIAKIDSEMGLRLLANDF